MSVSLRVARRSRWAPERRPRPRPCRRPGPHTSLPAGPPWHSLHLSDVPGGATAVTNLKDVLVATGRGAGWVPASVSMTGCLHQEQSSLYRAYPFSFGAVVSDHGRLNGGPASNAGAWSMPHRLVGAGDRLRPPNPPE